MRKARLSAQWTTTKVETRAACLLATLSGDYLTAMGLYGEAGPFYRQALSLDKAALPHLFG